MKEATGELNSTIIIFLAVTLLTALFFMQVWPIVKENFTNRSSCSSAICDNGYIVSGEHKGMSYCVENPNSGSKFSHKINTEPFYCPFRG